MERAGNRMAFKMSRRPRKKNTAITAPLLRLTWLWLNVVCTVMITVCTVTKRLPSVWSRWQLGRLTEILGRSENGFDELWHCTKSVVCAFCHYVRMMCACQCATWLCAETFADSQPFCNHTIILSIHSNSRFSNGVLLMFVKTGTPIDTQCSICMEDTLTGENSTDHASRNDTARKGLMFTVCGHVFHSSCLDTLTEKGREAGRYEVNCPNCRSPISAPTDTAGMLTHAATAATEGSAANTSLT